MIAEETIENVCNVHTTGLGKSGLAAQWFADELSMRGKPAFFIHPEEALHGQIGRIRQEDLVIFFSNSMKHRVLEDFLDNLHCPKVLFTSGCLTENKALSFPGPVIMNETVWKTAEETLKIWSAQYSREPEYHPR